MFNPLSPHDAPNHHFASLKNGLVSYTWGFYNENFHGTVLIPLIIIISLFHLPPTSSHFYPLQVENCDSNSRLVVDEDDNGKFSLERVNDSFRSQ